MKLINRISTVIKTAVIAAAIVAAVVLAPQSAKAQGRGFDLWGASRVVTVTPITQASNNTATTGTNSFPITNGWIDIHAFNGVGYLSFFCCTNWITNIQTAGQLFTNQPQVSNDGSNWVSLTNYAFSSNLAIVFTNYSYGGTGGTGSTNVATNNTLLPGVIQNPTASTAGFATPYLLPNPFTNSAAVVVTPFTQYTLGFKVDDQLGRYLRCNWTTGGQTFTNATLGAWFTGVSQQ